MKPEDIDKLFKERLGPSSPTPPADLWNRLQDRIETEMPATDKEEAKPRGFMYLSYSIAAAIALILTVGVVFFNVQRGQLPLDGMAKNDVLIPEQPLIIDKPATTETATNQGIAQATESDKAAAAIETTPETTKPVDKAPTSSVASPKATIAKATTSPAVKHVSNSTVSSSPAAQMVTKAEQPALPTTPQKGDYYNTGETMPIALAANTADLNAQPVEIIIKRAVYEEPLAEEEPELSGFEKKQKLAKNIFKQVRNLSNGEKVELSELGINADRIALETQIGKQKISKVIHL